MKWSLAATGVVVVILGWQCGSALREGGRLSDAAVAEFHRRMNAGDFEAIYSDAEKAFQQSASKEENLKFLGGVHDKLGNAGTTNRGGVKVEANMNGTFVTVSYRTTYERGVANETFVWRRTIAGDLVLVGYHVQSNAFIVQ